MMEVLRNAKVRDLGCAVRAYQYIAGFQVAMQLVFLEVQEHQAIQDLVNQARDHVLGNQRDP